MRMGESTLNNVQDRDRDCITYYKDIKCNLNGGNFSMEGSVFQTRSQFTF